MGPEQESKQREPLRDDVIAAARPLVDRGVANPDDLLDSTDQEARKLRRAYSAYVNQETGRIQSLPVDEAVRASIALGTVWYDAGFRDPEILGEITGERLLDALFLADTAHRRDLADEVKAKIREIEEKINAQNPDYEIWDPDSEPVDWNAPTAAPPAEFYIDYAYYLGPDVDAAVSQYMRYHPDADEAAVRADMQRTTSAETAAPAEPKSE